MDAIKKHIQKHDAKQLSHSHLHLPIKQEFKLANKSVKRLVLDAWDEHGSALIYYPTAKFKFLTIKPND